MHRISFPVGLAAFIRVSFAVGEESLECSTRYANAYALPGMVEYGKGERYYKLIAIFSLDHSNSLVATPVCSVILHVINLHCKFDGFFGPHNAPPTR